MPVPSGPAALPEPCYVFGDSHLGFAPREVEANLLAYLRYLRTHAGSVVINGDLFEFWFEWRSVVPRSSVRVLAALADLADAGVPVLMIAGNHDCWGGDVLRDDIGVDFRFGPWTGPLAGWATRIEHGDGLRRTEDRGYRALRRLVLRNPVAVRAFRWVHPDLAIRLASASSTTSRTYVPRDGGRGLRAIAAGQLAADPTLELLLLGHSHVPALERLSARGVYGNAGSWLDAPTFLRVTGGRVVLRHWLGSSEGPDLDAIDRLTQEPGSQA